jgi:hypothetical protein
MVAAVAIAADADAGCGGVIAGEDPAVASRPDGATPGLAGARRPEAPAATGTRPADVTITLDCAFGGGLVEPDRRGAVTGGGCVVVAARGGNSTPVAGALRARRGGSGGSRRPHDWQTARSSAFSALQNGQNRMLGLRPPGRGAGRDLHQDHVLGRRHYCLASR